MLFCSNDIEVLLHKAEWCFGVRLPADENALRYLFFLQPNDYLLIPQLSLPLLLAWFGCAFANADVGDFDRRLTAPVSEWRQISNRDGFQTVIALDAIRSRFMGNICFYSSYGWLR